MTAFPGPVPHPAGGLFEAAPERDDGAAQEGSGLRASLRALTNSHAFHAMVR
jgi:hypothetical protein